MIDNVLKLQGVHPDLFMIASQILKWSADRGTPMVVTDGVRTADQQHQLWRIGREIAGTIVTHCDGYHTPSNHQAKADGYGHAIDMTFIDINTGRPRWSDKDPWAEYGAYAKSLGAEWGGDWTAKKRDRPHIQLPESYRNPDVLPAGAQAAGSDS